MRRVTIGDVARHAGVSRKTVSRVVNHEGNVSRDLRKRVEKVVAQLNYVPDRQARSLRSGKSYHVAFVYEAPSSYFVISLVDGIRRSCKQYGYELILHETEEQGSRLVMSVLEFIERERLDGLLMMPPMTDNEQLLAALAEESVLFGRISPGTQRADSLDVFTTDRAAGREMAEHLLDLGHRRIAFIQGHPDHLAMAERLAGASAAISDRGDDDIELIVRPGRNTFESGLEAARELLALKPRPTAIFAANDDMAAGVLFEAQERGLRVPDDVSVAGFDNTLLAARIWPGLTTIHQPIWEMGELAAKCLIDRISGREVDSHTALPTTIVRRRSTGKAPQPMQGSTDAGS